MKRRKSKTGNAVIRLFNHLGGIVYEPGAKCAVGVIWVKAKGKLVGPFGLEAVAEHDGFIVAHQRRPSGKWDRPHRASHHGTRGHGRRDTKEKS